MATPCASPLPVSLGDPAGIGPEVVGKCWDHRAALRTCRRSSRSAIRAALPRSGTARSPRSTIRARPTALSTSACPILPIAAAEADIPGHPSVAGAHCSLDALELAVGLARSGSASAVVTGPVSKQQLYGIGFAHPGQTEFVAERCGCRPSNVAMMLAGPTLRTVPVTTHMPLAEVADALSPGLIEARGRAALRGLQRNFGIADPRLAVAGLNPHAGEGGSLGREEIELIMPAIEALQRRRLAGDRPAPGRHHVPCRRAAPTMTRRCACTMTRR